MNFYVFDGYNLWDEVFYICIDRICECEIEVFDLISYVVWVKFIF